MALGYFVGLSCIWLVPSFATESAVRLYYGLETATMAYMIEGEEVQKRIFSDERRGDLMRRECISQEKSGTR